jgi:hypothetical protein
MHYGTYNLESLIEYSDAIITCEAET